MKTTGLIVLTLALSGCATGYHSASNPLLGITGGFTHKEGYGSLTKVSFYGNGFTQVDRVTEYTLRRSAELAVERGKPYFAIYRAIYEAHFDEPSDSPNYFVLGSHPNGYAYVQFFDAERKGAFRASEILSKYQGVKMDDKKDVKK